MSTVLRDVSGRLGAGWSSDNDMSAGNCFLGGMEHVGTPVGSVSMDVVYNYDDVMSQLNFKSHGNFSLSGFKAGSVANYSHMLQDTNYSKTFIYRATILLKNRRFVPPKDQSPLTWIGQQYANDPVAFRANCGDKFIVEQQIGGMLYVAVKFHFHTQQEKSTFNAAVKSSFMSLGSLNANLEKLTAFLGDAGTVSVTAFQMGGDPTQLGKMLGADTESKEAPILSCSFEDLQACSRLINQILAYASRNEDGNFLSQFTIDDVESLTGPGVISNILQNTSTLVPIKIGPTLLTQSIIEARFNISQEYEQSLQQSNLVNEIISNGEPFSSDYLKKLQEVKNNIEMNNQHLRNAGQACYEGDLSQCLTAKQSMEQNKIEIDLSPFRKKFLMLGKIAGYLSPYSDHQFIYSSRNHYFPSEIFTMETFTTDSISLVLPTMWIKAISNDNGSTYQGRYCNQNTYYVENVTLIPDF